MQLKRSSGKNSNDDDLDDTTNQSESEITSKGNDEDLENPDETVDMESYIDAVSQQMSTNMAFNDRGSAATSSGNSKLISKKVIQDSSLPEVCARLEVRYDNEFSPQI